MRMTQRCFTARDGLWEHIPHTETPSFWRTPEEFRTSMRSTLVRVQSDPRDNGVLSAPSAGRVRPSPGRARITGAPYKPVHVSLCSHYSATLYVYCAGEFLRFDLFDLWGRSSWTAGLKKEQAGHRPHTWRHTFFKAAICLMMMFCS